MRKLHGNVLSRLSPSAPKNVAVSFSCFSLVNGTFCSQKLNRHQDQGAVFGMDASSAEAQMKGGKSISIVAQTLSGGWGSAQPFGMSPGRERRRRPSKRKHRLMTVILRGLLRPNPKVHFHCSGHRSKIFKRAQTLSSTAITATAVCTEIQPGRPQSVKTTTRLT